MVPLALVALVNLGFYALAVYPLSLKVSASETSRGGGTHAAGGRGPRRQGRARDAASDRTGEQGSAAASTRTSCPQISRSRAGRRTSIWRRWRGSTTWRFRGAAIVWTRATKGASNDLNIAHGADRRLRGHARFHLRSGELRPSSSPSKASRWPKTPSSRGRVDAEPQSEHVLSRRRTWQLTTRRQAVLLGVLVAVLLASWLVELRRAGSAAGAADCSGARRADHAGAVRAPASVPGQVEPLQLASSDDGEAGARGRRADPVPVR